jgi:hypothetical protein
MPTPNQGIQLRDYIRNVKSIHKLVLGPTEHLH